MGFFSKLFGKSKPAKRDTPYKPQCRALTAQGVQCTNSARGDSNYCASHKGYQPPKRSTAHIDTNTKPRVKGAKDTAAAGRRPAGKARCAGKTKAGKQCARDATQGSKYCSTHKVG